MRILVVSQGPVLSTGYDGSGNWTSYDCSENIFEIANELKNYKKCTYIPLIWDADIGECLAKRLKESEISFLALTPVVKKRSSKYLKPSQKKNMYYACREAARYADQLGYTLLLKIRHDQSYDFSTLIKYLMETPLQDRIAILAQDYALPDSILDFVIAGRPSVIFNWMDSCYTGPECHPDTCFDTFYHLSSLEFRKKIRFPIFRLFGFLDFNHREREIKNVYEKRICFLPIKILQNLVWRGESWKLHENRYGPYDDRRLLLGAVPKIAIISSLPGYKYYILIFIILKKIFCLGKRQGIIDL